MDFIPKVQMVKEEVEEQPFNVEESPEEAVDEEVADDVMDNLIEQVKEVPDTPPASIDNIFEDPPSLTKSGKPRKKRKPLSEEHKAKLAQARIKATASRRRKAAEKKELKDMEKKEKELLKKQKLKKLNELEKSLGETPSEIKVEKPVEEKPVVEKPVVVDKGPKPQQGLFSKADLDEAVFNGISAYEKVRKQRKSVKKQEEAKALEQQKVKQTLMNAITPKRPYNPYANCY